MTYSARYKKALCNYLSKGDEDTLYVAYELGRHALERGMGVVEFVHLHSGAVRDLLDDDQLTGPHASHAAADRFLLESLGTFQMLQVSRIDSNNALSRLNRFLESESQRIAQLLHDESAQMLATIYLELSGIERERPTKLVLKRVDAIRSDLDLVQEQLRHISHELNPPMLERLGVFPALNYLADGICGRSGLELHMRCECDPQKRFPPSVETALYRGVQEALNNVVHHAHAREVVITLTIEANSVVCSVADDGVGFELVEHDEGRVPEGLGIAGIRARIEGVYGSLRISSVPEEGTTLYMTVPMVEEAG
jgi:signal transduction histidine kinase